MVLVIDEAQDMGVEEHALVRALMHHNEEMCFVSKGHQTILPSGIYLIRGKNGKEPNRQYHLKANDTVF